MPSMMAFMYLAERKMDPLEINAIVQGMGLTRLRTSYGSRYLYTCWLFSSILFASFGFHFALYAVLFGRVE